MSAGSPRDLSGTEAGERTGTTRHLEAESLGDGDAESIPLRGSHTVANMCPVSTCTHTRTHVLLRLKLPQTVIFNAATNGLA